MHKLKIHESYSIHMHRVPISFALFKKSILNTTHGIMLDRAVIVRPTRCTFFLSLKVLGSRISRFGRDESKKSRNLELHPPDFLCLFDLRFFIHKSLFYGIYFWIPFY
jgi:hypothetical protein